MHNQEHRNHGLGDGRAHAMYSPHGHVSIREFESSGQA
jgi:hypothetical protein